MTALHSVQPSLIHGGLTRREASVILCEVVGNDFRTKNDNFLIDQTVQRNYLYFWPTVTHLLGDSTECTSNTYM